MERNIRPTPNRTARKILARTRCRRGALALVALLAAGQGCYTYHVTELPAVTPGSEIRIELQDRDADKQLAGMPAALRGPRRLEGRFASLTEDSLVVSVWIGEAYAGTPFETSYQDLFLGRDQIARVENRQLNKLRTVLTSLGGAAVIAVLIDRIGFVDIFGNGGNGDPPPLPPDGFAH